MTPAPGLALLLALLGTAPALAETVTHPGRRTWTNSWVPPHVETRPDTRTVLPRNQPLAPPAGAAAPDAHRPAGPPVTIQAPPPHLDPYYNALTSAARPLAPARPKPAVAPR